MPLGSRTSAEFEVRSSTRGMLGSFMSLMIHVIVVICKRPIRVHLRNARDFGQLIIPIRDSIKMLVRATEASIGAEKRMQKNHQMRITDIKVSNTGAHHSQDMRAHQHSSLGCGRWNALGAMASFE